jgi:hypothetical protein
MQANVPQPAADEDDGDDVDEGRWRHDSSGSSLKQKSLIVFYYNFLTWIACDALVNSAVQRLEVFYQSRKLKSRYAAKKSPFPGTESGIE